MTINNDQQYHEAITELQQYVEIGYDNLNKQQMDRVEELVQATREYEKTFENDMFLIE